MMKKIWILLLVVSSVIGAIPAMANPLQDSMQTSDANNWKNLAVTVTGANWANNAIGQTLTSSGAQTNNLHDVLAGSGDAVGLASATASVNAPATSGNAANTDNLVDIGCGCEDENGGNGGGDKGINAETSAESEDNKAHANANGLKVESGEAKNNVDQSNKVSQDADAKIKNNQKLIQVVKIKEFQVAKAESEPEVDFDDSILSEGNTMMGESEVEVED